MVNIVVCRRAKSDFDCAGNFNYLASLRDSSFTYRHISSLPQVIIVYQQQYPHLPYSVVYILCSM